MNFLKGRTNRATYWLTLGIVVATMAALSLVMADPIHFSEVVLVWLCVPRLHDLGRSGWWMGLVLALEIIAGVLIAMALSGEDVEVALGAVTLGFYVALIVLGCIPGQPEPNRFGDPPPRGVQWGKRPGRA